MKKVISLLLAVIMIMGLFAGCGGSDAPAKTPAANDGTTQDDGIVRGGILNISGSPIVTWSPWQMILRYRRMSKYVYEPLLRVDENGNYYPFLAEIIPEQDKGIVTIKIREGVTFSDGSVLNAEVLIWNLDLWNTFSPSSVGSYTGIKAVDDMTVEVQYDVWDLDVVALLGNVDVISKKNYDDHASEDDKDANGYSMAGLDYINNNPIGTGAFTFNPNSDDYQVDVVQKFRARDDYWQEGLPYLDAIFLHNTKNLDDLVVGQSFMDGTYEYGDIQDNVTANKLIADGVISPVATTVSYGTVNCIIPNSNETVGGKPNPFADPNVRKALAMAIDIDTLIVKGFYNDTYTYVTHVASPKSPKEYDPSIIGHPYDVDQAIALLEAAGYTEANPLHVPITTANAGKDNCILVMQEWDKLPNVTTEMINADFMEVLSAAANGDFYGYLTMGVTVDTDSASGFKKTFTDAGTPNSFGKAIGSVAFRDAYNGMVNATSLEERTGYVKTMIQLMNDEALVLPMYYSGTDYFSKANVHNGEIYDYYRMSPELMWKDAE